MQFLWKKIPTFLGKIVALNSIVLLVKRTSKEKIETNWLLQKKVHHNAVVNTYSLPWLGVDFGSWCYKTFVFWLRGMSEWPWHPLDRPCKWPDGRNRPIWRPNGHPVDHKCWLISTGLARCHYPMAKCDSVAPIKLFLVAAKEEERW